MNTESGDSTFSDSRFLEALVEFEKAVDAGTPLTVDQLIERYPECEPRLREYFQDRHEADQYLGAGAEGRKRPEFIDLKSFGYYSVMELIDWGGTASIHRIDDSRFDRTAAIKIPLKHLVHDDPTIRRLKREARFSGRLQHPNIVPVYDVGTTTTDAGEVPYFTMRFIQGSSLAKLLNERPDPQRDLARFIYMFRQICYGVAHAHSEGILHCDLKPENVMVGKFDDPYVMDWGFAKDVANEDRTDSGSDFTEAEILSCLRNTEDDASLTVKMPLNAVDAELSEGILGTPCYLPPEVARSGICAADKRADVFCLGGILCRMLTGLPTFTGSSVEATRLAYSGDLTETHTRLKNSNANKDLISLAMDCLNDDPTIRPSDAAMVAHRVSAYIRSQEEAKIAAERQRADEALRRVEAERSMASEARARARAEKRFRQLSIAIGLIAVVLVALGLLWRQRAIQEARRDELFQTGQRAYDYGNHAEARDLLDAAIAMGDRQVRIQVARIRASFTVQPRSTLISQAEKLLTVAIEPEDKSELRFLLGDMLSCDKDRFEEGQSFLKSSAINMQISSADREYAVAVTSDSMQDCETHLAAAIALAPYHHRANVVRTVALLSLGRMSEAQASATLLKRSFPDDQILELVLTTCSSLAEVGPVPSVLEGPYRERLISLLNAYAKNLDDSPQPGIEQLTFARQAVVAAAAAELLNELPFATSYPGLPVTTFRQRAETWKNRATIAASLSPPKDLPSLFNSYFVNRRQLIQSLEQAANDEVDGIAVQMLAVAKFVELCENFYKWNDDEQKKSLKAILELETQCIERETLVPRSQFEMASRVLRILCDYQLSRHHKESGPDKERRMRDDVDYIFSRGESYPMFLNAIGSVLAELFIGVSDEKLAADNSDDLVLGMRMLSDWIAVAPENVTPRRFRARLWHALGRNQVALNDIEIVLEVHPDDDSAIKLRQMISDGLKSPDK